MTNREAIEWLTDLAREFVNAKEVEDGIARDFGQEVVSLVRRNKLVGPRFSYRDLEEPTCPMVCDSFGGCCCNGHAISRWQIRPELRWTD